MTEIPNAKVPSAAPNTSQASAFTATRAPSLVAGICIAILAETLVIHVLLTVKHHAMIAWTLTAASVVTLLWLVADDRAMRTRPIIVSDKMLHLRIGRRIDSCIPLSAIARIHTPDWRSLPARAPDYLRASAMDDPNVIIELTEKMLIHTVAGTRRIQRIGLRMDEPRAFIDAILAQLAIPRANE